MKTKFSQPPNQTHARIGLALGSGSARGWAHIGVIKALSALGIRPEIVTGTSIGALVGGAYASDQLDVLERWVCALSWKDIVGYLDLSVFSGGLIQGEKLLALARHHVKDRVIESLPHRFGAVATELNSGREIWLKKGSLFDAVRASSALPGLFAPVQREGRWLVDGGLVDPVPVSLCRAMGAEIVIAVNLNGDIVGKHNRRHEETKLSEDNEIALWDRVSDQLKNALAERKDSLLSQLFGDSRDAPGVFEVMAGSINIMQDRITRSRMAGDPPDIILSPQLSQLGLMEFDQAAIAIEEGKACVQRMRPALKQLLAGY